MNIDWITCYHFHLSCVCFVTCLYCTRWRFRLTAEWLWGSEMGIHVFYIYGIHVSPSFAFLLFLHLEKKSFVMWESSLILNWSISYVHVLLQVKRLELEKLHLESLRETSKHQHQEELKLLEDSYK